MSFNASVNSELAREKLHSATVLKQKQAEAKQVEQQVRQQPSATGLQWASCQQPVQTQTSQQVNQSTSKGQTEMRAQKFELVAPSVEDVAILSTAVSMNDESVEALNNNALLGFIRQGINLGALEASFKETFKNSKSHNLLLERFMANVKLSGISMMLSLCGIPAETLEKIKKEVREKALKEIDIKLSQDWAYAKAMLEIMG